MQYNFTIH